MYSKPKQDTAPPPDAGKYIRLGIAAAIGLAIFAIVGYQGVIFSMNVDEFADKFTKPLFYAIVSAIVLSAIALVRVNIAKRSSIFWYGINVAISFLNRGT